MAAIAHFIAITCYVAAAVLAATPFVRPLPAQLRPVLAALGAGVAAHIVALAGVAQLAGRIPVTGLGPSLSFAGLVLAITLLAVEAAARDTSLTLVAAPFAALATTAANLIGLTPMLDPKGAQLAWLVAHIVLSFLGIAAFGTAAAAGAMYLVQRKELKARRFGAIFRFFPPLETLDRLNHVGAIGGWVALTMGVVLAFAYSANYGAQARLELVWGTAAWLIVSALAFGRVMGGWRARRAALVSSVGFAVVVVMYVAFRVVGRGIGGQFL